MTGGGEVVVTSTVEVAAAARSAGVLVGVVGDGAVGGIGGVAMVVVAAHGGVWGLYRDPRSVLGWVAARAVVSGLSSVAGQVTVLAGAAGWLGAVDLEADRIVANLLEADALPVDLHLAEPFVSTGRAEFAGGMGGDTPSAVVEMPWSPR